MKRPERGPRTGAEALLMAAREVGIRYLFANAGTDFPPVIEAFAQLGADVVPTPMTIPHETVAVGMAHGFWLVTGEMQAVMVHVNVGLANAVMGILNAKSDNVPILVLSGRTPLTESGRRGARVTPIQYGQEMFDQTAMVREPVKFDYELRYPEQTDALIRRASAIARSDPQGPVYISLPREPLSDDLPNTFRAAAKVEPATSPAPDPSSLETLARWIDEAERPLVLCQRGDPEGHLAETLSHVAERLGLAVCEPFPVRNVLASDEPALVGYDPKQPLAESDLVIVLDADVPWIAATSPPNPEAKVVHISPAPLFPNMPTRGYRSDMSLTADPATVLNALASRCTETEIAERRRLRLHKESAARRDARAKPHEPPPADAEITPEYLSRCVSDVMDETAVAFSELGLLPQAMNLRGPNRLFVSPHSGGLGWAFPAALGAQLADRSRLVIGVMGDGSYMFANPVACHQVAEALDLPVLIVVKNNAMWNAVRRSVVHGYPDGQARRQNRMPLTSLEPLPDFAAVATASRAHAERVVRCGDLPAALERAVEVIRTERRHALLDVRVTATEGF